MGEQCCLGSFEQLVCRSLEYLNNALLQVVLSLRFSMSGDILNSPTSSWVVINLDHSEHSEVGFTKMIGTPKSVDESYSAMIFTSAHRNTGCRPLLMNYIRCGYISYGCQISERNIGFLSIWVSSQGIIWMCFNQLHIIHQWVMFIVADKVS